MGQIWLWNLEFIAELWGENSVTDNPYDPCDHESSLLVAMQCLSGGMCSQQLNRLCYRLLIGITSPAVRRVMVVAQMSMCVGMVVESLEKTRFPSGIKAAELVVTTAMTRPIFSLEISRCSWLKRMML